MVAFVYGETNQGFCLCIFNFKNLSKVLKFQVELVFINFALFILV